LRKRQDSNIFAQTMSPKVLAKLADESFVSLLAGSDTSFDFEKRLQGELI